MKYFIGLDAHSATCTFVALDQNGDIVREGKFKTSESGLASMIKSVDGPVQIAFEETNISHWIYKTIQPLCDNTVVCHAAYLPKKSGPKNDYRDALHIAKQLISKNLTPVFHDDPHGVIDLRTVVANYQSNVDTIVQQKMRLKAIYRSEGLGSFNSKSLQKHRDFIDKNLTIPKSRVALRLLESIKALEDIKKQYQEDFRNNVFRDPHYRCLRSIPGIGPVRAHIVSAYITTGHRFESKHKLWAYAKLVRHQNVSDGIVYSRKVPHGRSELKNAFMGAALKVIVSPKPCALKKYYQNLVTIKKIDPRKARKSLARKIAAICLVALKKGVKYNDAHVEKHL